MFFLIILFRLQRMTFITQKEWDAETTTAGDYTFELKITPSMLSYFHNHSEDDGEPEGYALKKLLVKELEEKLTNEVESQHYDESLDRVNIVDIFFSYKNADLLYALAKRGKCIKSHDWKGLKAINEKLDEIKNSQF